MTNCNWRKQIKAKINCSEWKKNNRLSKNRKFKQMNQTVVSN
jgi:hypothetical protein